MIKKFIVNFWPYIFIFLIWFIFSNPYFLQNKVPFASNYLVNFFAPWNSYPGFASPVKNNAMPDVISQIVPWKIFTIDSFKSGVFPLWNPYSFSGTPHLANYQSAVLSPFNILFFILPFIDAWSLLVLFQPLLAGIFMYLFLRSLSVTKISSLFGGVSFMFCGFITAWMGYATLGYAILFLPLSLYAIEKYYKSLSFKYLLIFSLTFPFSFFSGHFQISLYFLLFVLLYLIYKLWETKDIPRAFYLFLYLIFGLMLTAPQILPSIEAYTQSLRSTIFQQTEVIPWGYIVTFFAPDFLGNPVTRNDWFGHYAEWNAFSGTITILLALFALFFIKTKKIFFFTFTAVLALLLSFQSPIIDLIVFLKIPVLSTSAASRIIVLFSFSVIILGSLAIDLLISELEKRNFKKIIYWLISVFSINVFLWLIVLLKLFIPIDRIIIARQNLILPTIMLIVLVTVLLICMGLIKFRKTSKFIIFVPFILLILITIDMLRFSGKWQPFESKNLFYPKIPIAGEFQKISGQDRVFGNLGTEATVYYKLSGIEGYDAVYVNRYGEFMSSVTNGAVTSSSRSVVQFPKQGLYSQKVLDLLGVKYLVYKLADGRTPWTYPFWNNPTNYNLIYEDGVYQIFENKTVHPRTFLVNDYKVVKSDQDLINSMFAKSTDLKKTVFLDKDPKIKLDFKNGSAKINNYSSSRVDIKVKSDGNALLFLSDVYYPGWKVFVDGVEKPIYKADFTFRAVFVSKGDHLVNFIFDPDSFKWGVYIFITGIVLIFSVYVAKRRSI